MFFALMIEDISMVKSLFPNAGNEYSFQIYCLVYNILRCFMDGDFVA